MPHKIPPIPCFSHLQWLPSKHSCAYAFGPSCNKAVQPSKKLNLLQQLEVRARSTQMQWMLNGSGVSQRGVWRQKMSQLPVLRLPALMWRAEFTAVIAPVRCVQEGREPFHSYTQASHGLAQWSCHWHQLHQRFVLLQHQSSMGLGEHQSSQRTKGCRMTQCFFEWQNIILF